MDYRLALVTALLSISGTANAAYATLTPPPGWSAGGGAIVAGSGGSYAATTANAWIANAAKSSAMLNVGGRQIAIPVSMKLAPTAGRVAAAALFVSPHLRAAAGIASWLGLANIIWDEVDKIWKIDNSPLSNPINKFEYHSNYDIGANKDKWFPSYKAACNSYVDALRQQNTEYINITLSTETICNVTIKNVGVAYPTTTGVQVIKRSVSCPAGWYMTPAGCTQVKPPSHPLTQEEMADLLNPDNTPGWPSPTVPGEFPSHTPFPIELPLINPGTGVNPFPKPLFVPTGQPVPNPKYDPNSPAGPGNQPWKQPGTTVTPRPTVGNPWQVDVAPTDREQAGPEPVPEAEQNPDNNPATDKPKQEEQQSLCEKHPDILACEKLKLGTVDATPLPKNTVPLTLSPEPGFGPSNGTCPADKNFVIMGKPMAFKWTLLCDFASQIRPLIVGFAYLSAALVFFGFIRKE